MFDLNIKVKVKTISTMFHGVLSLIDVQMHTQLRFYMQSYGSKSNKNKLSIFYFEDVEER